MEMEEPANLRIRLVEMGAFRPGDPPAFKQYHRTLLLRIATLRWVASRATSKLILGVLTMCFAKR